MTTSRPSVSNGHVFPFLESISRYGLSITTVFTVFLFFLGYFYWSGYFSACSAQHHEHFRKVLDRDIPGLTDLPAGVIKVEFLFDEASYLAQQGRGDVPRIEAIGDLIYQSAPDVIVIWSAFVNGDWRFAELRSTP